MQAPRFVSAGSQAEVQRLCGIDRPIDACTRFIDFALTATCDGADDQWMMSASARILPLVVVLAPDAMTHEYVHISDMRQSASKYLHKLDGTRYSTKDRCEDAASREIAGFASHLKKFAQASNAMRHPGGGRGR
ncbi:MAG TPA: hypothetical protein VIF83_03585 [Gemmatimonadaceae bacterium]|jgi:hypothetical protein